MPFRAWRAGLASIAFGAVFACTSTTNGVVGPGSGTLPNGADVPVVGGSSSGGQVDASACTPSDQGSLQPTWHPPHPHVAACDAAQMDSLFTCIRDAAQSTSGTPASCAPWGATASDANRACYECIFTDDTQAQWGALVVHSSLHTQETNYAGCAAIAEAKLDGTGCGGAVSADVQCGNAACGATCPVDAQGNGLVALNNCLASADEGTCARFSAPAQCLFADGGPLAPCDPLNYADDVTAAQGVANVFCGGGAGTLSDAGGD
jgi:hypothetical protein